MATKKKRMTLHEWDGVTVLDLGNIEIWDGADLALLRETLTHQIESEKCRSIGVNMKYVKYIPSGFFGMLFDWHEKGVSIRLYEPQPNVEAMLWFRQFFDHVSGECHLLLSEPKRELKLPSQPNWNNESFWGEDEAKPEAEAEEVAPPVEVDGNQKLIV